MPATTENGPKFALVWSDRCITLVEREIELLKKNSMIENKSQSSYYWKELRSDLLRKRNRMANILERAGLRPIVPQGGYFMLADFSAIGRKFPEYKSHERVIPKEGRSTSNDFEFSRWLSAYKKLQVIPASAFYSKNYKQSASDLVRFCFIKQDSTLDALETKLENLNSDVKGKSNSSEPTTGKGQNLQRSKL